MHAPRDLPHVAADILTRLRERRPRVHCITNAVAQAFTANMLLALGAVPSMTIAVEEVGDFVARADALLVNLGTMDAERQAASGIAIAAATKRDVPWLLDPVFVDRSAPRAALARTLLAQHPRAVRLNATEFSALAGVAADDAALARYATDNGTVVGLTGDIDIVTDGARTATIANGDPLMTRVTAMGCAASAVTAACLAVERDAWLATASGLLIVGVAGEIAASLAKGPGTLAVGILDTLYELDPQSLIAQAKVG